MAATRLASHAWCALQIRAWYRAMKLSLIHITPSTHITEHTYVMHTY
jgi:hypothetical protein